MSWEMLRTPYTFTPSYGGTIGYRNPPPGAEVCGGLFHTDEFMQPLWWNGGVIKNKHSSQDAKTFMTYDWFAFDTVGEKVKWIWETNDTVCVSTFFSNNSFPLIN
jgi:hypothetical protein